MDRGTWWAEPLGRHAHKIITQNGDGVGLAERWGKLEVHTCLCFHCSDTVSLVGAFNVLIDVYDPVIIFLSVLGLLSVGLFLLLFPAQTSSFNICCKVDLVVLNSLNFCFSGKHLISPSNLKESLAGQSILDCRIFPFITLNISCHSLLACRVSVEKSADSLNV